MNYKNSYVQFLKIISKLQIVLIGSTIMAESYFFWNNFLSIDINSGKSTLKIMMRVITTEYIVCIDLFFPKC